MARGCKWSPCDCLVLGARACSAGRVCDSVQHGCPTGQLHVEILEGETDCATCDAARRCKICRVELMSLIGDLDADRGSLGWH